MSLWVDKHRPKALSKLTINPELTNKLLSLSKSEELPHLLVYGPSGAGKKTRVMALLKEIFGSGVEKIKLEHRSFQTPSQKVIEISTMGSNYHIECNPSDAGNNDRFVTQEVIKEIASHTSLSSSINMSGISNSNANSSSNATATANRNFKVVILTEVDRLSKQAQASLRRTMERYSAQCRLILICNSPSRIIDPLKSRCLSIRVPAPKISDISDMLVQTANKEKVTLSTELATKMALLSDRNMRRALLMLEASKVQHGSNILPNELPLQLPDWEIYITRLARDIMQEQSPAKLINARDMLYELLTNCIPADVIIITLTRELMKSLDDSLKHELSYWSAYYEHRLRQGSKDIFHLEAFVAKFMAIYKKWIVSMFS